MNICNEYAGAYRTIYAIRLNARKMWSHSRRISALPERRGAAPEGGGAAARSRLRELFSAGMKLWADADLTSAGETGEGIYAILKMCARAASARKQYIDFERNE